jgi:hypothetical protein
MRVEEIYKTKHDWSGSYFIYGGIGEYGYYCSIFANDYDKINYDIYPYKPVPEKNCEEISHFSFNGKNYPVENFDFVGRVACTGCNYIFVNPKFQIED